MERIWRSFLQRLPGTIGMRDGYAFSLGKIAAADLPTCNATRQFEKRVIPGAAGVADREVQCVKAAANTFAWEDQGPAALGTTYQPLDATLTSLAAYNTAGLITQTAADTFTGRTITGTANSIAVTNGSGVAGNPTLAISSSPTLVTPTIAATDWANANHIHAGSTTGGVLTPAALGMIVAAPSGDYTGANNNSVQKMFDISTNGAATLPGSTGYIMHGAIHIHTTGTTSHTLTILFGGTATYTAFDWSAMFPAASPATEVAGAQFVNWVDNNLQVVVSNAAATATHHTVIIDGVIRTNVTGTWIPQYQWSTAPGVAGATLMGSYITLMPFGTSSTTTVGTWS